MMSVDAVFEKRIEDLRRKESENDLMNRQIVEAENKIDELVDRMDVISEALLFLENVANSRRGVMKEKIEDIVTEAIRMIYGDSYRLEISYSMKNNRSSLDIHVVRDTPDGEVRRAMGGFGCGLADCISVPIRLLVLLGSRQANKVCILDECYKHLDDEQIHAAGQFLRVLTDKLGVQIINISHHRELRNYSDKTFMVSELDGVSMIEGLSQGIEGEGNE
jgi:hypothetical protein